MQCGLRPLRGRCARGGGRLDEALALYRLAADALPGWWLVDEHIAEALELQGDARAARPGGRARLPPAWPGGRRRTPGTPVPRVSSLVRG